jgi:hypothetical protein
MAWLAPFNKTLNDWRGRSVWLVGASSGIGLACAKALHAQGAKVCVSARQAALLQAFADQHPGSMALPLDVTDKQAMQAARKPSMPPMVWTWWCIARGSTNPNVPPNTTWPAWSSTWR